MFFKFIWDNKPDKIKRWLMFARFNIPNVVMYDCALNVAWIKRTIRQSNAFWSILLNSRSHKLVEQVSTGDASAKHFCSGAGFRRNQNIFWQNVFECWGAFKASCADDDEILNQPIHLSTGLQIGGDPFWNKALFDGGCRLVRDVCRSDGRLKSFDELNRQFSIPFSRTVLQGLIRAVRNTYGSQIEKFNIFRGRKSDEVATHNFPGTSSGYLRFLRTQSTAP